MLKRRILAVERRLAGLVGPAEKTLREVVVFDDDPEPQAARDEELFVVRVVNTNGEKAEAQEREKGGHQC